MRARGIEGELRVGYHVAARLGDWTLSSVPTLPMRRYRIEARVLEVDTYWVTQPVVLILYMGRQSWIWRTTRILDRVPDSVILEVIDNPLTLKEYPCPLSLPPTSIPGSSPQRPSRLTSNGTTAPSR